MLPISEVLFFVSAAAVLRPLLSETLLITSDIFAVVKISFWYICRQPAKCRCFWSPLSATFVCNVVTIFVTISVLQENS